MEVACKVLDTTNYHNKEWQTYRAVTPKEQIMGEDKKVKAIIYKPVFGHEIWKWPETKAFLLRLGFDWEAPTTRLRLDVETDDLVRIMHEFTGLDMHEERK